MMYRIEVTDENGVVLHTIQATSYHLAWEDGGKLRTASVLDYRGPLREEIERAIQAVIPGVMGKLGGMFGRKGA